MRHTDVVRACTIGNRAVAGRGSSRLSPSRKSKEPLSRRVSFVIDGKDLMYWISKLRKRRQQKHGTDKGSESYERSEKMIKILLTTTAGSMKYTAKNMPLMLPRCLMRNQPKEISSSTSSHIL